MEKDIYSGKPTEFYDGRKFANFLARINGSAWVTNYLILAHEHGPGNGHKGMQIYHLDGVTIRLTADEMSWLNRRVTVSLIGSSQEIGEVEKKILSAQKTWQEATDDCVKAQERCKKLTF